jgi:hypothetical protein
MRLVTLLFALSIASAVSAQTASTTFTFAPHSGACAVALTQDGAAIGSGWYICFQGSAFTNAYGFSVYLPSDEASYYLILEGCGMVQGSLVFKSTTGLWNQQDSVACAGWSGTVHESFYTTTVINQHTHKPQIVYHSVGGSGRLTQ